MALYLTWPDAEFGRAVQRIPITSISNYPTHALYAAWEYELAAFEVTYNLPRRAGI